jgi:2-oxoglutarate dehydrogenase E2 component (dihydrolipoamide succinyltransferase)
MTELENIPGTGNEGRVTKKDILQYVSERKSGARNRESGVRSQQPSVQSQQEVSVMRESAPLTTHSSQLTTYSGNVEIIEMDRMRKLIAEHMVRSKHTSPHVTSFVEADVTNLVLWRDKVKKDFEKREGTKITFTPLFIEAIVRCIKKFPLVNCSLDGDKIIIKKDINIGMATALPSGNLIVPVIRNADQLNLVGLTKQVNALADNARNNKLRPEDTQGGTFTLTNVGTFGSLMGTPIINQPQVAILAVGAIKKRPVVVETPAGDSIAIRHMMYLSMSYDHRIVDGSLGATFLTAVAKELENFNGDREY